MAKVRVLIVEDELLVAEEMANVLTEIGYLVPEIVDNTKDARRALEVYKLDILLIDIKLKGEEDGISLAQHINEVYSLPIVFVTSLVDQNTIDKALSAKPSAYLVKPYNKKELQIALSLALRNFESQHLPTTYEATEDENTHYLVNQHVFVKDKHRLERVDFEDILWLKAESSYVSIATKNKVYLLTSDTLGSLLSKIDYPEILRVHRSFAVNTRQVEAIDGNRLSLNQTYIPIGKNYRNYVKKHLNIL